MADFTTSSSSKTVAPQSSITRVKLRQYVVSVSESEEKRSVASDSSPAVRLRDDRTWDNDAISIPSTRSVASEVRVLVIAVNIYAVGDFHA